MKGIKLCAECANYSMRKHACKICKDPGAADQPFYNDCPLPDVTDAGWISCNDRLPEEQPSIFASLKGTDMWKDTMPERTSDDVRCVCEFGDGKRTVTHSRTVDGIWEIEKKPVNRKVIYWMENPEPPTGE